jgi:hypothetical protein
MMAAFVSPPLPLLRIKQPQLWSGNSACGDVVATDAVPDLSGESFPVEGAGVCCDRFRALRSSTSAHPLLLLPIFSSLCSLLLLASINLDRIGVQLCRRRWVISVVLFIFHSMFCRCCSGDQSHRAPRDASSFAIDMEETGGGVNWPVGMSLVHEISWWNRRCRRWVILVFFVILRSNEYLPLSAAFHTNYAPWQLQRWVRLCSSPCPGVHIRQVVKVSLFYAIIINYHCKRALSHLVLCFLLLSSCICIIIITKSGTFNEVFILDSFIW